MEKEDIKEIEINKSYQEIFSQIPKWLLNSGIYIFLSVILIGLAVLWFVEYPNTSQTRIMLTSMQPPVKLYANTSGFIKKMLVKNNDSVKAGDVLIVLNSRASYQEVAQLKAKLSIYEGALKTEKFETIDKNTLYELKNLGELQIAYNRFLKSLVMFNRMNDKILARFNVNEAYIFLKLAVEQWYIDHVLVAPVAGKVVLQKVWAPFQHISKDEEVLSINSDSGKIIGRIFLDHYPSEVLKLNQEVLVDLDAFPKQDYGYLSGNVSVIPSGLYQGGVFLTVKFESPLVTNQNKQVLFKDGLVGNAKIIHGKTRLFKKMLSF